MHRAAIGNLMQPRELFFRQIAAYRHTPFNKIELLRGAIAIGAIFDMRAPMRQFNLHVV